VTRPIIPLCLLILASASPLRAETPPPATALWTISSDDCVGVDTDGEPWQECGIQAFDLNEDASRILTVSTGGTVQLWDGAGRELRRVDWGDQPSGASGYPDAAALVSGNVGIAIVHQNQLLLLDLADGRILAQRVIEEAMTVRRLAHVGGRVFAEIQDKDWHGGAREIVLPSGELRDLPGTDSLARAGPAYWVDGSSPPFTLHRGGAEPPELPLERSCMPLDASWCIWREIPGSTIHFLDVAQARWHDFDVGRTLGNDIGVDVVVAGDGFFAIVCEPPHGDYPYPRSCSILDLATGRTIYRFETGQLRAVGALDERGRPEIRLALSIEPNKSESRRVSVDGTMRMIDPQGRANLIAPGGGMVVAGEGQGSMLIDQTGRAVATFPFHPQSCGNGWPGWQQWCRFSADGRKWLIPSNAFPESRAPDNKTQLTLYELPPATSATSPTPEPQSRTPNP
jgi:hypothetical protein